MLQFKRIDITIQSLLITSSLLAPFIVDALLFLAGYFIVGGWQFTSFSVHYFRKQKFIVAEGRRFYAQTLACILLTGSVLLILTSIFSQVYFVLFLFSIKLFFTTPFIAFWYLAICVKETKEMVLINEADQ